MLLGCYKKFPFPHVYEFFKHLILLVYKILTLMAWYFIQKMNSWTNFGSQSHQQLLSVNRQPLISIRNENPIASIISWLQELDS
jgi:hypothetical protein